MQLYTQLLSKREESDTGVRRVIFSKLLEKYLTPGAGAANLDDRLVVLELLSQNFNESLDLSPLFSQLDRQNEQSNDPKAGERRAQLERIAGSVKLRQYDLLDVYGAKVDGTFDGHSDSALIDEQLEIEMPGSVESKTRVGCHFIVDAWDYVAPTRQLKVRVQATPIPFARNVVTGPGCGDGSKARQWVFSLDPYDFPLVSYTRMSKTERFVVYSIFYAESQVRLRFVYFSSSLNGVRDKPFIDEVMNDLRRSSRP